MPTPTPTPTPTPAKLTKACAEAAEAAAVACASRTFLAALTTASLQISYEAKGKLMHHIHESQLLLPQHCWQAARRVFRSWYLHSFAALVVHFRFLCGSIMPVIGVLSERTLRHNDTVDIVLVLRYHCTLSNHDADYVRCSELEQPLGYQRTHPD
jgi:hypothetical protein